jgi:hypothetical protein
MKKQLQQPMLASWGRGLQVGSGPWFSLVEEEERML